MVYGTHTLIAKPSHEEEAEIRKRQEDKRKKEKMELSIDEDEEEAGGEGERNELPEEEVNIRTALNWKRRHFLINTFFVSMFLMVKMEFSYTDIFGKNILYFQVGFTFLDVLIEQIITRLVMGEALLSTPILSYHSSSSINVFIGQWWPWSS